MRETFPIAAKLIGIAEGGFSNRSKKDDPGGATMKGVTLATYSAYRRRKGLPNPTVADLKRIPDEEVLDIFRNDYWNQVRGDELPAGVDLQAADFAFNSGPGQAMTDLQRVVTGLGFDTKGADGKFGSHTGAAILACLNAKGEDILINAYAARRLAFMQKLKNWNANKNGWKRRVEEVRLNALNLAHGDAMFSPTPPSGESAAKAEPTEIKPTAAKGAKPVLLQVGGTLAAAATAGGQQLLSNSAYQPADYLPYAILGFLALSAVGGVIGWFIIQRQAKARGVV